MCFVYSLCLCLSLSFLYTAFIYQFSMSVSSLTFTHRSYLSSVGHAEWHQNERCSDHLRISPDDVLLKNFMSTLYIHTHITYIPQSLNKRLGNGTTGHYSEKHSLSTVTQTLGGSGVPLLVYLVATVWESVLNGG